jgi:hypothetical protein
MYRNPTPQQVQQTMQQYVLWQQVMIRQQHLRWQQAMQRLLEERTRRQQAIKAQQVQNATPTVVPAPKPVTIPKIETIYVPRTR